MLARGSQGGDELWAEVALLSRCRHPHLLVLHGYCLEPCALCLVYPIARGGNLEDRLLRTADGLHRLDMSLLGCNSTPPLSWQACVRILCETLRALTYLHSVSPEAFEPPAFCPCQPVAPTSTQACV